MMKNGIYFFVIVLLVAELFKILIYALDDLWRHRSSNAWTQSDLKLQNMEYLCKYFVYRVKILQGWRAASLLRSRY